MSNSNLIIWFQLYDSETGLPYKGTRASKVSVPVGSDIVDFSDAVKVKYSDSHLKGIGPSDLEVFQNKQSFDKRDAEEDKGLPLDEDSPVDDLGKSLKDALIVSLKDNRTEIDSLASPRKRSLAVDLPKQLKKRKGLISPNLLGTSGSDFLFSERDRSFNVLLENTRKRYKARKGGIWDKSVHPIPFLANGPGSGKSRFLQELSGSFKDYVQKSDSSDEFKKIFNEALFININFGNGTAYSIADVELGIEKAICVRILDQVDPVNGRAFLAQCDRNMEIESLLAFTIEKVCGDEYKCIVLAIDEINKIHASNEAAFKELFNVVGKLSSSCSIFVVPVVAGTVVGPIKDFVSKSMHPPCQIPLPLLSLEACKKILKNKMPELDTEDKRFIQVVSDIGGHCRSLEYLYDFLDSKKFNKSLDGYWIDAGINVRLQIRKSYRIDHPALGHAIAYSFLSKLVRPVANVKENTTFLDLEEAGLIQLEPRETKFVVKIPFMFVWCYMQEYEDEDYYCKFWTNILIGNKIGWQEWEVFNRNYIAFRLSLYEFLSIKQVSVSEFFQGAIVNFSQDINFKIPPFQQIKITEFKHQYPTTKSFKPEISAGTCFLNASGAKFDAGAWLETASSHRILLVVLQMKLSRGTNSFGAKLINSEYQKARHVVSSSTDFVFVMLCRRNGKFKQTDLPENAVVVSNAQLQDFYGYSYFQRLRKNGFLLCKVCHGEFDQLKRYVDVVDDKLVVKVVNYSVLRNDVKHRDWIDAVETLKDTRLGKQRRLPEFSSRQAVEPNGEMALYFVLNNPTKLPNRQALEFHKAACLIWRMAGGAESEDEHCPDDDDDYVPVNYRSKSIEKWMDSSATLVIENTQ